jgi:hypothetical protein
MAAKSLAPILGTSPGATAADASPAALPSSDLPRREREELWQGARERAAQDAFLPTWKELGERGGGCRLRGAAARWGVRRVPELPVCLNSGVAKWPFSGVIYTNSAHIRHNAMR